jgi:hemolysin activation/secretion protein
VVKPSLLAVAFFATSQGASAQQQPLPDAGTQIQQIPPVPMPERAIPLIPVPQAAPPSDAAAEGAVIRVNSLRVTGSTLFPEAALIAETGFSPGKELPLSELRNAAAAITRFYNSRGYFLAQAYLPAQDINAGAVTIAVIEGHYGAINIDNQAHLASSVARRIMNGIEVGDPIAIAPLERRLLLLSDIPGIVVSSTLSPGVAVGTSDLAVNLTPGRRVTGSVEADNGGNRYTGIYRFGGTINFNNPTGLGDQISLRALASTEGLAYGRAAYQAPVGDGTLGVAYTHLKYELGQEFSGLNARGDADIFSAFGSYPVKRSRADNLYAFANFDVKNLKDEIGLFSTVSKRTIEALTVGVRGDSRDTFGGGGWNAYSVSVTSGNLDIKDPFERANDALTARSAGGFNKLQYSVARRQTITGPLSLYGAVRGQLAFDNLDSSEKMELGGAYAVRAYPEGEGYGDEGYVATLEARLMLDKWTSAMPGRLALIGFVETGAVNYAHEPWFSGPNHTTRSGIGTGLIWSGPHDITASATYAHRLGDQKTTSGPDRAGRVWFQIAKQF